MEAVTTTAAASVAAIQGKRCDNSTSSNRLEHQHLVLEVDGAMTATDILLDVKRQRDEAVTQRDNALVAAQEVQQQKQINEVRDAVILFMKTHWQATPALF